MIKKFLDYLKLERNYSSLTVQEYGDDFMKVPKTIYNHGFFDALSQYDDVLVTFERNISLLKEINFKYK